MIVVCLVGAATAPSALAQYDTYYSPEKRFSIDYLPPSPDSLTPLNIIETQIKQRLSHSILEYI